MRQVRKYQVQSRKKLAEEEIDLIVYNPSCVKEEGRPEFLIFSSELPFVQRAVVVVKGWHTTLRFTPAMLKNSSEVLRFLEKNVLKKAEDLFGENKEEYEDGGLLKILVLPGLPTSDPHRTESIHLLREHGVDGIISFRSMLQDILAKVETNLNYQKSETLQILRILKNYDMIKDPQMELFSNERR